VRCLRRWKTIPRPRALDIQRTATKIYAVKIGRQPGIYSAWADCEAQVKGFSSAEFKSFATADLAQAWLTGESAPSPSPPPADGVVCIYTDGACSGNPGPSGYCVVLVCGAHRKELAQGFARTTNNRMELRAAIAGLEALKRPTAVTVVTDSRYLMEGANRIERQKRNRDLWATLATLLRTHTVTWEWVKGHAGHSENERCDQRARAAIISSALIEDTHFSP
jgi:ribonuclease HI